MSAEIMEWIYEGCILRPLVKVDFLSRDQASDLLFEPALILLAEGDSGKDGAPLGHCNQIVIEKLIVGLIQADLSSGIAAENGLDPVLLFRGERIHLHRRIFYLLMHIAAILKRAYLSLIQAGMMPIRLEEPGRVHLQSLPLSRLADRIIQASRLDICRAGRKEAVKAGARARLCP